MLASLILFLDGMEPVVGIEPTTDGLQNRCSTTELNWPRLTRILSAAKNSRQAISTAISPHSPAPRKNGLTRENPNNRVITCLICANFRVLIRNSSCLFLSQRLCRSPLTLNSYIPSTLNRLLRSGKSTTYVDLSGPRWEKLHQPTACNPPFPKSTRLSIGSKLRLALCSFAASLHLAPCLGDSLVNLLSHLGSKLCLAPSPPSN